MKWVSVSFLFLLLGCDLSTRPEFELLSITAAGVTGVKSIETEFTTLTAVVTVKVGSPCFIHSGTEVDQEPDTSSIKVFVKRIQNTCIAVLSTVDVTVVIDNVSSPSHTVHFWVNDSTTLDTTVAVWLPIR